MIIFPQHTTCPSCKRLSRSPHKGDCKEFPRMMRKRLYYKHPELLEQKFSLKPFKEVKEVKEF